MKILFLALALTAGTAYTQRLPPKQEVSTVVLANAPVAERVVTQMTQLLIIVAHVDASFDSAHSTFTLRGGAGNLGLAEWLLHQVDRPTGWQPSDQEAANLSSRSYLSAPGGTRIDDNERITHVYYLKSTTSLAKQEILTIARIVGLIPQVVDVDTPSILVFRGNTVAVDLLEWMLARLDSPTEDHALASQSRNSQSVVYPLPVTADGREEAVRIFYLSGSPSTQTLSTMNRIRDVTNSRNIFAKTAPPPAIVIRAAPAVLAQAQQIIDSTQ